VKQQRLLEIGQLVLAAKAVRDRLKCSLRQAYMIVKYWEKQ